MTRCRARGYTMMEIVVTMALFGVFLFIIVTMTAEMRRNEKKWPVNFFAHPEVGSVLARMRRDIYDSTLRPPDFEAYSNTSPLTLIVYTINNDGTAETVVWDFTTPGEVHRKAFKATLLSSEWMARGLPLFAVTTTTVGGHDWIRIQAMDKEKKLAIDELIVPRPHE